MTPFDLLAVRWLLASVACLVAGGAVWGLTAWLRRRLPALAAQRSVWLLAQLTVAGAFCLALLPPQARVRLVPPVDIEAVADSVTHYVAQAGSTGLMHGAGNGPAAQAAGRPWLTQAAWLWFGAYVAGLAAALIRLARGKRLLERLAAGGTRVPEAQVPIAMIEVDAPVSPMLLGPFKPRLLVPRHLRELAPLQQQLIVAHELTHWRRHDLHWMLAGLLLQTLFWFNPFMRRLRGHLAWAQELGCDRDVLRGRPAQERKTYAAALLAQLQLQRQPAMAPVLAFGAAATPMAERIALIRTPADAARSAKTRWAALLILGAAAIAGYALQPALAWQAAAAQSGPLHCTTLVDAASGQALLRQGQCDVRVTPVSTFNIAVSLMGYDSGILKDEHTPKLPFREGYADWIASWRADTDPSSWIRNSTVWYARQVTAQLGEPAFRRYLAAFGYGNRDTSGDAGAGNGLTHAWINSSLQISPDEQVTFLRRLVNRDLGLNPRAYDMTGRLLKYATLPNGWDVYGKTGTGSPVLPDGRDDEAHAYGWFVGWAVKGPRTVVFARLVQDQQLVNGAAGPRVRDAFLRSLPAQLDAL
jgi:beta-lactamase class D/beta-lactamase regulating signal transducer with metallopeptidase domain